MVNNNRTFFITLILIFSTILLLTLIIVLKSPYYKGFESNLIYLSADLSESNVIIRDKVIINKESLIKIVFEEKDTSINYDRDQFNIFLKNLEIRVWRNGEYFRFNNRELKLSDLDKNNQILIGSLKGLGEYTIYIQSDSGKNATYNIGVGIGRESNKSYKGNNVRSFY